MARPVAVAVGQPASPADRRSECLHNSPCRGFAVNEVGGIHYCYFKNTFNQMPGGGRAALRHGGVLRAAARRRRRRHAASAELPPPSPPPPSPPPPPAAVAAAILPRQWLYKEDRGVNALGTEARCCDHCAHEPGRSASTAGLWLLLGAALGVEELLHLQRGGTAKPAAGAAGAAAPSPPPMTPTRSRTVTRAGPSCGLPTIAPPTRDQGF